MATGADIPPELFERILADVCEDAEELLDLDEEVPNRKQKIKTITTCSLTCVYWGRMCRWRLFRSVWIKDYEDMRAFSSLVAHTPERFEPITAYVQNATLVQRVGERSWIHLLWMQPSLFLFEDDILISLHIEETSSDATAPRRSTCQRLFAGLPRTPPSSCLRSDYLTLTKPHFVTPRDLTSLVGKFKPAVPVLLTGVTWDAQARFDSDLLTTDPLRILPSESHVAVTSSRYTAETAWLVFVGAQRYLSLTRSIGRPNGSLRASDLTRQVLPSAQRTILVLGKLLCGYQGHKMSFLTLDPHNNANTYTIFHQDNDISGQSESMRLFRAQTLTNV